MLLPASYSQEEVGDIHGKLTDKKLSKPIANHPVTLKIHKAEEVTQQETNTDENGNYSFDNLPLDIETHYTVSTSYDGAEYIEKDLVLSTWVPTLAIDIDIGGKTDDPSQIRIRSHTIVIGMPPEDHVKDGALAVIEALDVENLSNSPFQSTRRNETVGFNCALPEGYEKFHPHAPESLTRSSTGNHIVLTDPLPSGLTQIGYRYILHAVNLKLDLSRRLNFHTDQFTILVPAGINLAPHSSLFQKTDTPAHEHELIGNVFYHVYQVSPPGGFSAGKTPDLELGIPEQVSNKQVSNIRQMAFIAIAAALAGGFLVAAIFMLRAVHRSSAESETGEVVPLDAGWLRKLSDADLEHARTSRLEFITLLDTMHEKQDISERVFNRLRKEQTERLTEILEQRKERGLDN